MDHEEHGTAGPLQLRLAPGARARIDDEALAQWCADADAAALARVVAAHAVSSVINGALRRGAACLPDGTTGEVTETLDAGGAPYLQITIRNIDPADEVRVVLRCPIEKFAAAATATDPQTTAVALFVESVNASLTRLAGQPGAPPESAGPDRDTVRALARVISESDGTLTREEVVATLHRWAAAGAPCGDIDRAIAAAYRLALAEWMTDGTRPRPSDDETADVPRTERLLRWLTAHTGPDGVTVRQIVSASGLYAASADSLIECVTDLRALGDAVQLWGTSPTRWRVTDPGEGT